MKIVIEPLSKRTSDCLLVNFRLCPHHWFGSTDWKTLCF